MFLFILHLHLHFIPTVRFDCGIFGSGSNKKDQQHFHPAVPNAAERKHHSEGYSGTAAE